MSYNISTRPSVFTIEKRVITLKENMGRGFIDYRILSNEGRVDVVQVTTTLKPSLRMFEACDKIMKTFNITLDHQTLDHYVLNFVY